jgi:phospholipase D1/2
MLTLAVTKGMSENAVSNIKKGTDVIIKPVALVAGSKSTVGGSKVTNGDDHEREDFDREGKLAAGFAGSMVPTIEEKIIFERRPSASHREGKPLFDLMESGEVDDNGPDEAEVPGEIKQGNLVNEDQDGNAGGAPKVQGSPGDKEKFGAPANAVPDDNAPPTRNTTRSGASEQEAAAIAARKTLRKHLSAKVGNHPVRGWDVPEGHS